MGAGNTKRRQRVQPTAPQPSGTVTCAFTRKVGYPNSRAANRARDRLRRKGRPEKRAYLCSHCHYWHLTSKDDQHG